MLLSQELDWWILGVNLLLKSLNLLIQLINLILIARLDLIQLDIKLLLSILILFLKLVNHLLKPFYLLTHFILDLLIVVFKLLELVLMLELDLGKGGLLIDSNIVDFLLDEVENLLLGVELVFVLDDFLTCKFRDFHLFGKVLLELLNLWFCFL